VLDPVGGVGLEANTPGGVKLLRGTQQAQVPLRDQVLEGQALALILAGKAHHQPQVGPDQVVPSRAIALLNAGGQFSFLSGSQEGGSADFGKVRLHEKHIVGLRKHTEKAFASRCASVGVSISSLFREKYALQGQERLIRCPLFRPFSCPPLSGGDDVADVVEGVAGVGA
jgi:hypothetical protein